MGTKEDIALIGMVEHLFGVLRVYNVRVMAALFTGGGLQRRRGRITMKTL
jgi:hypothetical protein